MLECKAVNSNLRSKTKASITKAIGRFGLGQEKIVDEIMVVLRASRRFNAEFKECHSKEKKRFYNRMKANIVKIFKMNFEGYASIGIKQFFKDFKNTFEGFQQIENFTE